MMKMSQVVIVQCEGCTQHKPEVVDCYKQFRDFLHQILKVYAPKRNSLKNMLFSLNFVKFMGNFCKVFAAYKHVRDSSAFLYHITGILLMLSTTINFGISQSFLSYPF